MATKQKKTDRRALILDAAVIVFAQSGFDRARVSDIARAAGVADGTIYLYFKNKDDLLIRLFEERINPVINQLDDHVTSSGEDPRGQLMALVEGYLAGVGDDPKMATLITKQVRQSHEFMTSYSNEPLKAFMAIVERIFRAGQRDGVFRRDVDVGTLRWMVWGALDAFALAWIAGGRTNKTVLKRDAEQLAAVLLRGLGTGEQPSLLPYSVAETPHQYTTHTTQDFDPGLD